ncbi:hypothetical protein NQ314_006770, partial [Rhamnusium bicolor]
MESNPCAECAKTFSSGTNLRQHVRKFHPTKCAELAPFKTSGKVFKFPCDTCSKRFNDKRNLTAHKRKFHDLLPKTEAKSAVCICPLCSRKVAKDQFETHMHYLHDLPLIKENIEFPSYDYFIKWKNGLEQKEEISFVRDSISNEKLERLHLLTRKDLLNIERCFNLNSESCRHANDAISVDALITEMKVSSCVRFYNPQDSLSEQCPGLKNEDFMLIIMNEAQCEILKKFGTDCICIDGTHGMNSYGFEIVTLMVIDEMRQGFPCAFLICNRTDQETISIFYEHIKKYTSSLKPNVFMSDMADSFYNAWLAIMDRPAKRLYCSWHVDHAWRKNLSKVKTKDKQIEVYHLLRTLLEEKDIPTFEIIFNQALKVLMEDSCTQDFGCYFRDNYLKNTHSWAYCFRLHAGLNTNMHLERMHKTIKYIYLKGRNVKRLVMLHKGKITSKVQTLRQRHIASLKLDPDKIIEDQNGWQVSSTTNTEMYSVQENIIGCTSTQHVTPETACISLNAEDGELQIVNKADDDLQKQLLVAQLNTKQIRGEKLTERKQEFNNEMKTLIDSVGCDEELDMFMKFTAPVKPTLNAMRMSKETEVNFQSPSSVQPCEPANKRISQQR